MKELSAAFAFVGCLCAQGLDPDAIAKPRAGEWPAYYGDYSGRRFSQLSQINRTNVGSLTVAWTFTANPAAPPTFEGLERLAAAASVPIRIGDAIYFTLPDNVWAVDAQSGRQIWHYYRPAPGSHSVNFGAGMYKSTIYFGTPDAHVVALDARTGKKLWEVAVGDVKFGEAITMAPLVAGNHVIVGSSGEGADTPGFAIALDPGTGKPQWKWSSVPQPGRKGSETWAGGNSGEKVMVHGGGHPSMTPTYDPDLNLLYLGTGSPRPTFAGELRAGDNLYTSSIVALNADSGSVAWYYQTTPHDTHGWDALATPVLADLEFQGKPRKLLLQANRNGRFFVLDRATGENLLSAPYLTANWPNEVNGKGQPVPQKDREPRPDGVLAPTGASSSRPASFSPNTKLFYVNTDPHSYSIFYHWPSSSAIPRGRAGVERVVSTPDSALAALDYQTGATRWTSDAGGVGGVLSTAGGLVFTSGANGSVVALDADTGKVLWHSRVGATANSPITYELGGRQYIITPAGASLFAWSLPER